LETEKPRVLRGGRNSEGKGEFGFERKVVFVLGEQRRVLGYHKANVRRSIGARISRLGELYCMSI